MTFGALTLASDAKEVITPDVDMSDQGEYTRWQASHVTNDETVVEDGIYDEFDAAGLSDLYINDNLNPIN